MNSDNMQEMGQKMTGSFFYEILKSQPQAWALATSLWGTNKGPRTENWIKKRAQAFPGAQ